MRIFLCVVCIAAGTPYNLAASSPRTTVATDFRWVRGVNYVPSTAHNDVATWHDYSRPLVEQELAYAAAAGFNAIRVFLSTLPWLYDRAAFVSNLAHFIATLEGLNLTSQLVVFDSCFGNVTADVSWLPSGRYKNATWIPNPGPGIVSNESAWAMYNAYVRDVVATAGSSQAVALYDAHNEPAFDVPLMVQFINYTSQLLTALDPVGRPVTVGISSSAQQHMVQGIVTALSFHNYNGGAAGAALAADIAGQRALADALGKPLLLTEAMSRPHDVLTSVLPGVFGCFNSTASLSSSVGFFLWELMLGVDQFNNDWSSPFQGLVYPASAGQGGAFRYPDEQTLLSSYFTAPPNAPPCPATPNGSLIPDTSTAWSWAPPAAWTAWSGDGPPLGTLHYSNEAGAVATVAAPPGSAPAAALVLVFKRGPDCGVFSLAVDGAANVTGIDSFAQDVDWAAEMRIELPTPSAEWVLDIVVTGRANPRSANAYVQVVGVRVRPEAA